MASFSIFILFIDILYIEVMRNGPSSGNIGMFLQLFEVNYSKVKNLAYSLLKSEVDAEDVAQEVFAKLWEQQTLWVNNERELDGYIMSMAKNIALNISKHQQIRQEYKKHFIEESLYELKDIDLLEGIYYREILQSVHFRLESLPERRKTVFELSRFQGKSNKEIAEKMNISVRTVEQQIYLTLIDLRKLLRTFS